LLHLSGRVFRFFVSDSQLTYLYRKARCFIFPSLYEGFGIPILESFAAGCPIALSNTSCFPEIAQEGGMYFDPYNVDSMVHILSILLNDDSCRDKQIVRGYEVLKQYSWKKMAEETAIIYRSLL
jgi:glycosyltransferase involved in cell wall biosynthesis